MTPQELKNSILQRAIQGRLVEQRPEEGTAEELYREIQAEKQRLVKAGKMKKEKPLPEISEDEIPFDIPESWKWVRISELGEVIGGGTPKTGNTDYWDESGIAWLTPADMKHVEGKYASRGERNISIIGLENSSARLMPKGTVLYSSRAPIGYIAIAANDISTNQGFKSLVPSIMEINEFLYYCLIARTNDIVSRASGTTFKEISGTDFGLTVVPLPPLPEQRRIVTKIEELLHHVDHYCTAWNRLEAFNLRFPSDMRKSLLQRAIQGRLVEQRPEEGTGEELYREIQKEKQRRIKAGELKREKPLPEISEDEIPFDIPESWKWVRLGEVFVIERGGSPRPIKNYLTDADDGVNWIKIGDTDKGGKYINGTKEKIIPAGVSKSRVVHKGDFLLSNSMSFGRPYILNIDGCIHDGWLVLRFIGQAFDRDYLYFLLSSPMVFSQFSQRVAGAVVNNLNSDKVAQTLVPMPPLAEQQRIVTRLEKMLPLCERIYKK